MRPNVLKDLLGRQPFVALRLLLSNGNVIEIRDPDLAVVTRSTVEILMPTDDSKNREFIVNLLHIIWIEVLESPA